MEKSFSITPWKYGLFTTCAFLVVCNIFFLSCGVVTWGSGMAVHGGYGVALCGAAIFGAAFLGIYVALKESYKYSIHYLISTGLVAVLLVVYFFTYMSMKGKLVHQFEGRIKDLFERATDRDDTMRPIHALFACCGVNGPQDYTGEQNGALPASCCYAFDCTVEANLYTQGCSTKAVNNVKIQSEVNYYMTIVIFLLELLGLFAGYFMGKARKMMKLKEDEAPINED
ncbi:23 kDa integral membrane protein [Scaptodrosophila lebanonensis]|uniref:23 kDa integral membrane protein n=1 Tax=Drosophila lebanonensis TaxID=7225 RepID=A0A6J2UF32_DROLE|nr:23 kDa integral membrane protein [Scaptodrosophila lebanonensis]